MLAWFWIWPRGFGRLNTRKCSKRKREIEREIVKKRRRKEKKRSTVGMRARLRFFQVERTEGVNFTEISFPSIRPLYPWLNVKLMRSIWRVCVFCTSICHSLRHFLSVLLSVCLSDYLSVCLSICLSVRLSLCLILSLNL